jgi:hypothetical protein
MVYTFVNLYGEGIEISFGCSVDVTEDDFNLLKSYENKERSYDNILSAGCCGMYTCFKCTQNPKCFKCKLGGIKILEVKKMSHLDSHLINAVYVENVLNDLKKD